MNVSDRDRPGRLDRQHRRLGVLPRRLGIPAIGAATVTRDGVEWVAVTGERVRGGSNPPGREDRWHIGSCGKSVTAALFARFVERGDVRWDTTIPDLFGDLQPAIHPGWRAITVEEVLTHRSGLPGDLVPADLAAAYLDERPLMDQRHSATARALAAPPEGVGSFRYSNLGYIVVGSAIERITGRTWEHSVVTEVLQPLGITTAGFGAPTGAHPWGHRPRWPRLRSGRGAPIDPGEPGNPNVWADNPPVMSPAGRLHLTLDDWAKLIGLFLANGGSLLRPSSITRITTAPPGPGPRQGMGWALPTGRTTRQFALGQQGSNTFWVATALVAPALDRAALVVCNDGRRRLLNTTARLAVDLLTSQ